MITDEQLNERESWERCAANAYDLPDEFVVELIREVRELRHRMREELHGDVPGMGPRTGHGG